MIKKYSSPRGDGNKIAEVTLLIRLILRNIAPREGTETGYLVSGFWIY